MNYVELRAHSEYSLGFSCARLDDLIERASELKHPAICVSERDSLRGVHMLHRVSEKAGVRPIYGIELGVVPDRTVRGLTEEQLAAFLETGKKANRRELAREERRLGLDRASPIVLRALDDEGLRNLFRLSSVGWVEGFYLRPRIDLSTLALFSAGVSVSVGGTDGYVMAALLRGELREALRQLDELSEMFGVVMLEIQPHGGEIHRKINQAVHRISEARGLPVIATNDVRYTLPDDTLVHTITLCLERSKRIKRAITIEEADHPRSQAGYHLRSGAEMAAAFTADHPDLPADFVRAAIERTVEIAALHNAKAPIDPLRVALPDLGLPVAPEVEVRRLVKRGWNWRRIPERAERNGIPVERYAQQLVHELKEIGGRKFDPYFLIVRDVINWARAQRIMVGPGRGSSAGSLVCYLLGITSIDPLEHKLMFERFLAPGRVDMPDIDTDFQRTRRDEVIGYLRERYGAERVAHIATHGAMHGKGALKDVGRAMAVPLATLNAVTATWGTKQGDEKIPVREVLEATDAGVRFIEEHGDALAIVERLEGSIRQVGVHASGVVVTPVPVSELIPVEMHGRKGEQTMITGIDMNAISDFGILKLDVLGLGNLDVLAHVRERIAADGGAVDFESLRFDDRAVIDGFTRQEFTGVFQYDAQSARSVTAGLTFKGFEDIVALTALNRPGPARSGLTEQFRRRRIDPKLVESFHPTFDDITADTLGVLVYQEQVIRIFREIGGFTPAEADKMRKIMGKKLGADEMNRYREQFMNGASRNGMGEDDADELYSQILRFAEYAFNRAHSAVYGAIAYWEMWCKVHHPAIFVWALMVAAKDSSEALEYVGEARRLGVPILTPDVNESGVTYVLTDHGIRAPLAVKQVGVKAVRAIVAGQPYATPSDFFGRVTGRDANVRAVQSLIKAGAMRRIFPNTKWALESAESWTAIVKARKFGWEEKLDALIAASNGLPEYDDTDLLSLAMSVAPQSAGAHPMDLYRHLFPSEGESEAPSLLCVPWIRLNDPSFWSHDNGYVAGVVTDLKLRTVGDFDRGEKLSDEDKAAKGYGRRYAMVTIEDGGMARRIKVDPDNYDRFGSMLERGEGKCFAFYVDLAAQYHSVRGHIVADLESLRQKTKLGIPLSPWEKCFTAEHPVRRFSSKRMDRRPQEFEAAGLVISVKEVKDRNGNLMGFFRFQDGHGIGIEIVVFKDQWEEFSEVIRPGALLRASVRRDRRSCVLTDEGITEVLGEV